MLDGEENKENEVKEVEPEIRYVEKIVEVIKAPPPPVTHHKACQTDVIEEMEKPVSNTVTQLVPEPII